MIRKPFKSQELRRPEPNKPEVEKLVAKLRLLATKRQAVEKIVSSEKFTLEEIKSIIESVEPEDKSNERKENRDFNQWLSRLNQVIKIYETLIARSVPDEPVVDSLNLFPVAMRESIGSIFELVDQLGRFPEFLDFKKIFNFLKSGNVTF